MSLLVMAGMFGIYWIGTSVVNGIRIGAKVELTKAMDSVSLAAKARMVPILAERDSLNSVVDSLSKTTQQRIDSLRALIARQTAPATPSVDIPVAVPVDTAAPKDTSFTEQLIRSCTALANDCERLRVANDSLRVVNDSVVKTNEKKDKEDQLFRIRMRDSIATVRSSGVSKRTTLMTNGLTAFIFYVVGRRDASKN